MFTGLVQVCGTVAEAVREAGDLRLAIACGDWPQAAEIRRGESIAVNGVCLTAARPAGLDFGCDVSLQTLSHSNLGELTAGDPVNLERAVAAGERFGGHLVSGHADGVGELLSVDEEGRSRRFCFSAPVELSRYITARGSICVDGVSLTVTQAGATGFCVNIIPHTLQNTLFARYRPGARVNLEVDLVARYLESLLGAGVHHNKR